MREREEQERRISVMRSREKEASRTFSRGWGEIPSLKTCQRSSGTMKPQMRWKIKRPRCQGGKRRNHPNQATPAEMSE